jgi:uncharacterized membrane protein YoaK (UPF0700 family)
VTTTLSSLDTQPSLFRRTLPPMLSFVSGFVDTCGFLGLFGLLTSQVTGSFVAAGAAFVQREPGLISKLLAMPMFMIGAAALTLMVARLRARRVNPMPSALLMVAILIALFWIAAVVGQPFQGPDAHPAMLAAILAFMAMGAQSALVRVLFKGSVPANFMTGNVTQVAVELTELTLARAGLLNVGNSAADLERVRTATVQLKLLVPMIASFILGTCIGAHAFITLGYFALVVAAGLVFAAAIWAHLTGEA